MAVRIICIKRDEGEHENPYVAIDHLEWVNDRININGISDRAKIYDWIKNGKGEAYIVDQFGKKSYLIPAISPQGNKYVKTVVDETVSDCLLTLPECTLC
jgi:hypothetical protein